MLVGVVLLAVPVLVGAAAVPAGARATTAEDPEATPLSVLLTSMSPATIPQRGVLTLAGVVRNISDETWTDINVAPFVSSTPITTRSELAEAAETEETLAVGDRLVEIGDPVGDLAPGRTARFTLRLPVATLPITGDPGVYWIGAHALASGVDGRDAVADGRARTFIPLVTADQRRAATRDRDLPEPGAGPQDGRVPVSLVFPVRERVRRTPDGSLEGPSRWARLTSPSGRLAGLAEFAAAAGDAPLTWVLDPAVLDALDHYSNGNPPLSLGAVDLPPSESPTEPPRESPTESPSSPDRATPSPTSRPSVDPLPNAPTRAERGRAGEVLQTLVTAIRDDDLLATGYADPDVGALLRRRPSLVTRADTLTTRRLLTRGLTASRAVVPPDGRFDVDLLDGLPSDTRVVLGDEGRRSSSPSTRAASGQQVVLSDSRASSGGPAPTRALQPLALRQRLLAEAALELDQESPRPVVVSVPPRWDPGAHWRSAELFGALRSATWLRLSGLPTSTEKLVSEPSYGREALAAELGEANVAATRGLVRTAGVLGHLLDTENDVTGVLTGAALAASSYHARARPRLAAAQVEALDAATRRRMDLVRVTGTDLVRLSGGSGVLTMTLVNGMEQPVTVGLRARATGGVQVDTPAPVRMGPGQRTTMRLPVTTPAGVHSVTLFPVTEQDERAGQEFTFSLRTSQVGQLIWYIIIAGGALLTVMIARRIVLRIRNHRWRQV